MSMPMRMGDGPGQAPIRLGGRVGDLAPRRRSGRPARLRPRRPQRLARHRLARAPALGARPRSLGQRRRARRRPAAGLRPRPGGLVAELAGEHSLLRRHPSRLRARPPRVRLLGDASEPISIDGYARILDDFLDAVGNSMGGFIAAEVAIRYSQRVGRLVLVSAAGITSESQRNDRLFAIVQRLEFLLTFMAQHPDARFMLRPRYKRLAKLVFEHPGSLVYEQVKGSGKPGFVPSLGAVTRYPIRDRLARIIAPTLIVWGERDRIVPPRDAQVFEQAIGHATRIMYPDTGHVPMLERPARFNHDVAAWLASEQ